VANIEIVNPDGSKDFGIIASDIAATDTKIAGTLAANDGILIGPRFIRLDFNDGRSATTKLNFVVKTTEGLFLNIPNPATGGLGIQMTMSIRESVPWGIVGIKFLRNGVPDSTIQVTNFVSSNGTTSVNLKIADKAPSGIRTIVLIGPDGADIPTSGIFTITGVKR